MADTPQATAITQPSTTPTGNPTLELKAGDIRVVNRGGLEVKQVFVPAGSFMMGSEDGESGERLAQEMTLDAFWIDQTEVTNAQYAACVAEGACLLPHDNSSFTREEYYDNPAYADYPVIQIGWGQTAMFAAWAGGRLPTEAEWEYAARGPESFAYPWGNIFDGKRLNFCDVNCPLDPRDSSWDDGHADTAPVGSYVSGASWAGALDMAGNVREYVNDPYATPATRWSAPAFIGGSWGENAKNARAAFRGEFYAAALGPDIGFRVVEPLSDPVP